MSECNKLILKSCHDSWEEEFVPRIKNKDNCSGFVKAVAKKLGIPLSETAKANEIVEEISSKKSKWALLDNGKEAAQQAHCGNLVLAGLKATDYKPGCPSEHDGHVVVVVDGELYHQKYPKCWGGSTKGPVAQSKGEKSVGQVWNRLDRDRVAYYAFALICRI